jgi:ABC-type polysaccharide/polyol phosphate transport system ATPase subunit
MEKIKRIKIENVSKRFMVGRRIKMGALARLVSLVSGKEPQRPVYVLKNLSFDVCSGEIAGIIGDNGSGKSTLLRIIAGIYQPDNGIVYVNGKIISLINLIVGLKERLTMKENIFLCCSLFGLSQKDAKARLQEIIEFSGLQEYADTKIYQFSEGMKQKLSFSIAVHCNPDILLLDEVFEVGDEDFKKKSADKIKELVSGGASVVLVSHDLDLIKKHCNAAMWLKNGEIHEKGGAEAVAGHYLENKQ